ncbi:phosphoribosylanthranilate isomerase [Arthrobacter sp.]|uniref:phosphoribosylanthranilate isomerase n=1 Tax=Arthrobacter sp. TaxID=1667 RepID=UPI00339B35B8
MTETYVKICGLRTPEAVAAAVDAGADAIGFVFAPGGPRTVSSEVARSLGEAVPACVETVGVFRNQPIGEVIETARAAAVSTVQLHGDEPLSDLRLLEEAGFRTLRAFSADAYGALSEDERADWEAGRILLDAVEPGAGVTFDATAIRAQPPRGPWLLAGGLTPANVGALIATLRPDGVDVSSGVESSRGVKDIGLIRDFVHAAKMR